MVERKLFLKDTSEKLNEDIDKKVKKKYSKIIIKNKKIKKDLRL